MSTTRFSRPQPGILPQALRRSSLFNGPGLDGTVLVPLVCAAVRRAQRLPAVDEKTLDEVRQRRRNRPGRPFEAALSAPGARFILEVKAASPSCGLMLERVDESDYARVFGAYADAVSVLTEPEFFGGSFARLASLRARIRQPILAKDVFVAENQILAAAQAGADAVLLMLSVLSDEGYRRLAGFAQALGLEILTEASAVEEIERARALGARLVGLNNRNLRTLEVDVTKAVRWVRDERASDVRFVAESGFRSWTSILSSRTSAPRIAAFLCGSVLSQAPNLSLAVRTLLYGHSKVCGITRASDAMAAVRAGAVSVGVILASRSPRAVSVRAAAALVRAVRAATEAEKSPVEIVAVTDLEEVDEVLADLSAMRIDVLQLHGEVAEMSPKRLSAIQSRLPGVVLAAAVAVPVEVAPDGVLLPTARRIERLQAIGLVDRVVLDAGDDQGRSGGTGRRAAPENLAAFKGLSRVVLAGGLQAGNLHDALRAALAAGLDLYGVDFNSGVEEAPGRKSAASIRATFAALLGRTF